MRTKSWFTIVMLALLIRSDGVHAQRQQPERGKVSLQELVSMVKTTPFDQAVKVFSDLSKKSVNKVIVDPEGRKTAIGVNIDRMQWRDAFELVLQSNNLWYEEGDDYIKITGIGKEEVKVPGGELKEEKPSLTSREVLISAVFFEADATLIRESGINWSLFRGNNVNLTIEQNAAKRVSSDIFSIEAKPQLKYDINVEALIKFFESNNLGKTIARPQITVRSGQKGDMSVATEFPVNLRDIAGNLFTVYQRAGTILSIVPEVYMEDGIHYIHLDITTERSSALPTAAGLEIDKTGAKTFALLLDGEETAIGGLYENQQTEVREGIPILKDLPWWVFGLRYLFGFNRTQLIRKDLIILIKANLLPELKDRVVTKENLIEKQLKENEQDTKFRKGEKPPQQMKK